jgi:thiosulfate/3-mercaptopyruvate sulfurtransferase
MNENVVVSADRLADRLNEVAVVDVREAWEYDGIGHVPGAISIPFDEFRSGGEADEGMLPGAAAWADLLGAAGITEDDTIVAYDDTHGVFAARFLVTAAAYGHTDLHLLDGDFSSWMRAHETSSGTPDVEPVKYELRDPENSPFVSREAVEAAMDDPDSVLVDTRDDWEFEEGHIPGAVNLDWKALVDDESRGLLPDPELRDVLDAHSVTPEKRVVLYCNTARRISHTYVVLRHLGYDHVDFFEGSLTEWRERDGVLETGD